MDPCECQGWARTDVIFRDGKPLPAPNHHPNCPRRDDSMIDVWKISFGGDCYYSDREPEPSEIEHIDPDERPLVEKERMHREVYDYLPEFAGF